MRARPHLRTWTLQLALAFAVWTLLAFVYAFQQVSMALIVDGRRMYLWRALWPAFETFWIYALLTPAAIEFCRRIDLHRIRLSRLFLLHLAGFSVFVVAQSVLRVLIFSLHDPRTGAAVPRSLSLVYRVILIFFNDDIFIYFPIVGAVMAYTAFAQERRREVEQSNLHTQLARAELQILKMQLHPHFLFNTLQAISTLVGKDPATAKRMIAQLGDLLRASIDRAGEQEVPLRDELDLLDRYVQIELIRFGDRLQVDFDIADDTAGVLVPALILQPLVENAIRHGARAHTGIATVKVSGSQAAGRLTLSVEDDGPGLPAPGQRTPGGLGLENTRARLRHLYAETHRFQLDDRAPSGLRVTLEIPARLREEAA